MTRENKLKAIELLSNVVCTVEMLPSINGTIYSDYIGITDCSHCGIELLIDNGYTVSIRNGKMIVDKF